MNIQRPIHAPDPRAEDADYDTDTFAWACAQRDALARRDAGALDWDNLAEELDSLGKSQLGEMESRLAIILEHLLKYEYGMRREPANGWKRTVLIQRADLSRLLRENPSLAARLQEIVSGVYDDARRIALAAFEEHEPWALDEYAALLPVDLPYRGEAIIDREFLPEPRHTA